MTEDPSQSFETSRRAVLGGVGATVSGLGFGGDLFGGPDHPTGETQFVLRQGDRCLPITPFSGDKSVEEFYAYRLPEQYASDENGGSPNGGGKLYSSHGTTTFQQPGASVLFCYDGPNGLSLVVVHGSLDGESGGSVTFEMTGMPPSGEWAVKDDFYRDSEGDVATSNYDNWEVGGKSHVIDWTWVGGRTDGGAFRGLKDGTSLTIHPAFNEAATLYGDYYTGKLESWQLLVPDGNGVSRTALDMTKPVTIEAGSCRDDPSGPRHPSVDDIEFKGCGEVWVVFEDVFDVSFSFLVETTAGRQHASLTAGDLETVPGQFGDRPLFKWSGHGKILRVETSDDVIDNPNDCHHGKRDDDDEKERDEDEDEGRWDDDDDEEDEKEDEDKDERRWDDDDDEEDEKEDEDEDERRWEDDDDEEDEKEDEGWWGDDEDDEGPRGWFDDW